MFPNLSNLVEWVGSPAKRPRVLPSDRVRKAVSAIQDAEVIEDLQDVVDTLENLTSDEIAVLANAAMDNGRKFMLVWFLNRYPHAIPSNELHMNATEEWWLPRYRIDQFPALNLERDPDGFVTVDLWHTRRGTRGPESFKDFRANYPTFFLGSRGLVNDSLDDLDEYIEEAEEWEDPEEDFVYVKRGRFRINPLLWFDDKSVATLRTDTMKAAVVASLVNSHESFKHTEFDLNKETDRVWKKSLYYKTEVISGNKLAKELRLDNNCVEESTIPLAAGYHGTLTVDVSGIGGAELPPGSAQFNTKSVVIWNVPGTLLDEWPWERVWE